jgi:transcriptional regulator with XRE-family HTH domain
LLYIFDVMNGSTLKAAREISGWTQARLAKRLGVTQAYLSLMESGKRRVPARLARYLVRLLDLAPTALPVTANFWSGKRPAHEWLETQLARLGYPGYVYRKRPGALRHPEEVLLRGLGLDELEPRFVESLPWLLLCHEGLDVQRLVSTAKMRDLQNRLGFVVALARQVAERRKDFERRVPQLRRLEEALEPSRLAREETFGQGRASERLRDWLRAERSDAARHWNLLTDLKVEQLPYAS